MKIYPIGQLLTKKGYPKFKKHQTHFYTDSDGDRIENPRYLRKSEHALKRVHKRLSRARRKLGRCGEMCGGSLRI